MCIRDRSRSKWIWSGITSIARILNLYSSASSYNIFLHSASIPFFRTCFRYFVHQTRWYCKESVSYTHLDVYKRQTSGITGLILPGMIEEPFCFGGRLISPSPARGPLDKRRRSLQILDKFTAQTFKVAEVCTNPSRFWVASNKFSAWEQSVPQTRLMLWMMWNKYTEMCIRDRVWSGRSWSFLHQKKRTKVSFCPLFSNQILWKAGHIPVHIQTVPVQKYPYTGRPLKAPPPPSGHLR